MAPDEDGSFFRGRWRVRNNHSIPETCPVEMAPSHLLLPTTILATNNPTLGRRQSKMSLFNLFSRPKVERMRGYNEPGMETVLESAPPLPGAVPVEESSPFTASPTATQPLAAKSTLSLRKTKSSRELPGRRTRPGNWDPPPLFQAYPQAVKHGVLRVCGSSAEELERIQRFQRQYHAVSNRLEDSLAVSYPEGHTKDDRASVKTKGSGRRFSGFPSIHPPELIQYEIVLTTSGHMAVYPAEGSSDRMPEQVLQLGKSSAAFASDLISGKHWVLQISESANDNIMSTSSTSKTLLSRLRVPRHFTRKQGNSILLVCDSAEEMTDWMIAIRRMVEELGGRRRPEVGERKKEDESIEHRVRAQQSRASMIQRSPTFGHEQSSTDLPLPSPTIVTDDWDQKTRQMREGSSDTQSSASSMRESRRYSVAASSRSASMVSHDQFRLDQLREGSRQSFISSRTSDTTIVTSRTSSPAPPSPHAEAFLANAETVRRASTLRSPYKNPSPAANLRRMSMHSLSSPTDPALSSSMSFSIRPQRHSVYGSIGRNHQSESPPLSVARGSRLSPLPSPDVEAGDSDPLETVVNVPTTKALPPSSKAETGHFDIPPSSNVDDIPVPALRAPPKRASVRKTGFRPVPIRPSETRVPDRISSSPDVTNHQSGVSNLRLPTTLPINVDTIPSRQQQQQPVKKLRRPASMQIRSDHAPFLASIRPAGYRPSSTMPNRGFSVQTGESRPRTAIRSNTSMPLISSLPPPLPPPTAPLPVPPPNASRVSLAVPHFISPPPNVPLPPPPSISVPRKIIR